MSGDMVFNIGIGLLAAAILLTPAVFLLGKRAEKKLDEYIKEWY